MSKSAKFVDQHPEREFANADRMAFILRIERRHVFRLAADGVLPRLSDGSFRINETVDAYIAYKTKPRPKAAEALDRRRTELLQRRLEREKADTIEMSDALETVDIITGAFEIAFDEIAQGAIAIVADPGRAKSACAYARAGMIEQFQKHRQALQTGKAKP